MNDMTNLEIRTLILELDACVDSASMQIRLCSNSNDPYGEMYHRGKRQAYFDLLDFVYDLIGEGD